MNTSLILDKRLFAYRDDIADIRLEKRVLAQQYRKGEVYCVNTSILPMYIAPDTKAMRSNTLLFGSQVRVFDTSASWSWVQSEQDGYVGYVENYYLKKCMHIYCPTHFVSVPFTISYDKPDIKSKALSYYPLLAQFTFTIHDNKDDFFILPDGGYIMKKHLQSIQAPLHQLHTDYFNEEYRYPLLDGITDYMNIARQFIGAPYLWGGNSWTGIDCSGLVALALRAQGHICLRDSYMQQDTIGYAIAASELREGDIVFFDGHVGFMHSKTDILHANMYHMQTTIEPLSDVINRAGRPLHYKRLYIGN